MPEMKFTEADLDNLVVASLERRRQRREAATQQPGGDMSERVREAIQRRRQARSQGQPNIDVLNA